MKKIVIDQLKNLNQGRITTKIGLDAVA